MKNVLIRRSALTLLLILVALPFVSSLVVMAESPANTVWLPYVAAVGQPFDPSVQVWLTDVNRKVYLQRQKDLELGSTTPTTDTVVAVDSERRYQTMVGFGASFTDSSAWLVGKQLDATQRAALMQDLFSRTNGIGLGMLRQPMGASDFAVNGNYSYDDRPAGQTDPTLAHFSINHDVPYIVPVLKAARAVNPELKITATPWSPPGWMKTSDAMVGGSLKPDAYQALADYFVRFLQDYQKLGVPVDYMTPQNEPLYEPGGYPGMLMPPETQRTWLRDYMGPALTKAGLSTQILAYDHNWDVPGYPETVYSDAKAASYVEGTAWHCYGGDVHAQTAVHNAYPTKDAHLTECSGGEWQGTPKDAFDATIGLVINSPREWARSVVLWNMALDAANGPTNNGCLTCRGVVTVQKSGSRYVYTKSVDYYALGHASKFVQPGAYRVASASLPNTLDNVAFRNPDNSNVLIVHNIGTAAQTFQLGWGDRALTYTLQPSAAATFVWNGQTQGTMQNNPALSRSVDIPFTAPDGSTVQLTYSPEQINFSQVMRSGTTAFAYSLPVGASLAKGGTETYLPVNGWKATASASQDPAPQALDGKATTRWSLGHGQSSGDWFQVDMGASRTFDGLRIDSAGFTGDFARNYQVYVSNDGIHWGSALASGPGGGQVERIVFPQVSARYVRVYLTSGSGSWWSIAEFRVFAASATTIPRNAHLLQQTFTPPEGGSGLAIYNPTATFARFPMEVAKGNTFVYILPPHAATIFTSASTAAPTLTSIQPTSGLPGEGVVLTGTNFGTWQLGSTVKFGETVAAIAAWSPTSITVAVPSGIPAGPTVVRVLVNGRASTARPFTVMTTGAALPRTGWTATASSNADGDVPSNVLDGDINTRWSTGTPQVPGQSLRVDMGKAQQISQVVMDSGGSSGDYARGYQIFLSTDGTHWGTAVATGIGAGQIVAPRFSPQTARYIRVDQTGSSGSWWSVAEFYAFK